MTQHPRRRERSACLPVRGTKKGRRAWVLFALWEDSVNPQGERALSKLFKAITRATGWLTPCSRDPSKAQNNRPQAQPYYVFFYSCILGAEFPQIKPSASVFKSECCCAYSLCIRLRESLPMCFFSALSCLRYAMVKLFRLTYSNEIQRKKRFQNVMFAPNNW